MCPNNNGKENQEGLKVNQPLGPLKKTLLNIKIKQSNLKISPNYVYLIYYFHSISITIIQSI